MSKGENVKPKKQTSKIILGSLTILLIIGLAVFGGFYFYKYNELKNKPAETAQKAQEEEAKQLIAEVGEKVELPKDEEPTIYTVQDKEKLQDQVFFAAAENGDKALIFTKTKIAVLYRPSTKKIINVGPVNIAASPNVTIIGTAAARDAAEATMNEKQKDKFKLVAKTDAKLEYAEALVVDLTGTNAESAKAFAETLGGKVGTLPEGETKPEGTDILIVAVAKTP